MSEPALVLKDYREDHPRFFTLSPRSVRFRRYSLVPRSYSNACRYVPISRFGDTGRSRLRRPTISFLPSHRERRVQQRRRRSAYLRVRPAILFRLSDSASFIHFIYRVLAAKSLTQSEREPSRSSGRRLDSRVGG